MEVLGAGLVIIGIINGVKLAELENKKSFYYFCGAVVLGVVFGFLNAFGLTGWENGLTIALQSSGLYKLVQVA